MSAAIVLRALALRGALRGRRISFVLFALLLLPLLCLTPTRAQEPGEQMLLESDQLVYDYDNDRVSAIGNVKIYYKGYTLEADQVTYDQGSGRLIAVGRVKLVDPTGAAMYSENFDITDDFRDGFVQSLRVDTPERAHFAAERAERSNGTTTFVNGVYTACEPCADRPEKPPLWSVRAAKIIVDQETKMVYFENASLQFLGMPIAWVPYFAVADPSVQRKSGFLAPNFGYTEALGFWGSAPYFWAIAPNKDLTFSPRVYTRQGFLADAEWRHRIAHGQYSLKMAGIYQLDKDAFSPMSPSYRDFRGGIRTTGLFDLSQQWTFGWDGTLSTDRTFTRDYSVLNGDTSETISTVHLTGLSERNYFETRGYYFQILTDPTNQPDPGRFDQGRQAVITPVVDHHYVVDDPVHGGELSFTSNVTVLTRQDDDQFAVPFNQFFYGVKGNTVRGSSEALWERRMIGPMGIVFAPFASVRGDIFALNHAGTNASQLTTDATAYRFMPAVGFETSLPVLATTTNSSHVIEPMAQLILRPNEMHAGELPNDDAQSLVFDDTNLFERDKFSGYDRVEGGTRLNVGVRYVGNFSNGAVLDALVGQSFHLAGVNPYATADVADVGPYTGLSTNASDYVGRIGIDTGLGPRIVARGRFDQANFALERGEVEATAALGPVTASASYLYLGDNPNSGIFGATSVVRAAASANVLENWRMFGTVAYDVTNRAIASDSLGIAYDDECTTFSLAYSETREGYTDVITARQVYLRLQLRTLGEVGVSTDLGKLNTN